MRTTLIVVAVLCVPTPLRADDSLVLFSDHFATLNPGWGAANANKQVSNNKLLLKPNANYSFSNIYAGNYFKDADIRVKVREASGGTDETAGLVFWAADTENYYVAQIRPDGLVGITRFLHGQQMNPVGYASNAAVNKGVGQVNELRVLTLGKSATLYVNGKQIATIKGFPPALGGRIGLHAESGRTIYTWEFSDLEVRQPAASAAAAAAASTASADPALIFSDDFSTLDPAWGPADGQQSVAGGKLVFQPTAGSTYTSLYQGTLFRDADIRVKIFEASGDTDEPAGIVFWATDYNNLYTAQVRGDGSVGISQLKQGSWRAPMRYTVQNAVAQGIGEANELRLVTQGKRITFYVNGQQVAAFDGDPPAGGSKIGLRAVSGTQTIYTWQFSDLVVRKP